MRLMQKSINFVQSKCSPCEGEILFLEYNDTITFTKQHGYKHLLVSTHFLKKKNINLIETNRGGDITFHGKGQLVGYPIIKLPKFSNSNSKYSVNLGGYIRNLEYALLKSCKELGVKEPIILKGKTGIWVKTNDFPKKLISIGIGISNGITRHGFALNINNDFKKFLNYIVPCGLYKMGVTNLATIFNNLEKIFYWENICDIISKNLNIFLTANLK